MRRRAATLYAVARFRNHLAPARPPAVLVERLCVIALFSGERTVSASLSGGAGNTDAGAGRAGKHGPGTACGGSGER